MKLLSYDDRDGMRRVGVLHRDRGDHDEHGDHGDRVTDVEDLILGATMPAERAERLQARGIVPASGGMLRWLQMGAPVRASIAAAIRDRLTSGGHSSMPLSTLRLRAPVARPGKIVAVGRNYADHAKETGLAPFEQPRIIAKLPSSVTDPGTVVLKPAAVQKMDFEAELAVVIGEFAHDVSEHDALHFVAGYTALNDLSAREFQFDVSPAQTTFAKSMDGFCPLGPVLVCAEAIADPQQLRVRSWVNDVLMQDASTADMLFTVRVLIAYLTQFMTLEPGDIIATGTPAGIGAFRTPPQWLQAGDRVRVEVSQIGVLETVIG